MKKASPATEAPSARTFFHGRTAMKAAFAGIVIFQLLLDFYWFFTDKTPYTWDDANHLLNALHMLRAVEDGHIRYAFTLSQFYPPLYYVMTFPFMLFTVSRPFPVLVNILFTLLLAWSVYKIAARYFGKTESLVAALLVLSYPGIIFLRRIYMLDVPQTALSAVAVLFILRSEGFSRRKESALAGLFCALALLLKEYSLIYIAPVFVGAVLSKRTAFRSNISNLTFFAAGVGISLFWYVPNMKWIIEGFRTLDMYARIEGDPTGLTFPALTYYFQFFPALFSPVLVTLAVLGGVGSVFVKKLTRIRLFSVSTAIAFLAFSLIPNKDPRYILPSAFFLAVVSAGALFLLRPYRKLHTAATVAIAGFCMLQVLSSTGLTPVRGVLFGDQPKPQRMAWPLLDVVRYLGTKEGDHPVVILPDDPFINTTTFTLIAESENIPATFTSAVNAGSEKDIRGLLADASTVVLKTRPETMEYRTSAYRNVLAAYADFKKMETGFKSVAEFPMPDGTKLVVFRKR